METELRTLDDIFRISRISEYHHDREIYKDLKAEAVKWVKDLESRTCFVSKLPDCETATIALRKFMNITDEDLK